MEAVMFLKKQSWIISDLTFLLKNTTSDNFSQSIKMKKQLLIISLAVFVTISSAFAGSNDGENDRAVKSFKKEFAEATNVKWDSKKDLQTATFQLNGRVMFAYYSNEGELLGVSRNLSTTQLPLRLSVSWKHKYSNYWVSDLFELASDNESSYYITVENAETTIVLRAIGAGNWEVFRKVKKETI